MISEAAQDKIIAAMVNAAFAESGELADEIRREATKMAKRWGLREVPGLPHTFPRGKVHYGMKGMNLTACGRPTSAPGIRLTMQVSELTCDACHKAQG